MRGDPYVLPPVLRPDGPHLGYAVFQEPTLAGAKRISILQLSKHGGITLLDLDHLSKEDDYTPPNLEPYRPVWAPEVKDLERAIEANLGPLAERAYSLVDLYPAYQREDASRNP